MSRSTQILTAERAELPVILSRLGESFSRGNRMEEPEDQGHMLDNMCLDMTEMLHSQNFNNIVV